ncbi:MAG: DNA-protecting protein DprA [Myxococcales bacterium]|nr:DNA-protecting protein DprA [Myxococcales bacterium]
MDRGIPSTSATGVLTLLGLRGIGPQTADRLVTRFGTLGELREASPRDLEGAVSAGALPTLREEKAWEIAHRHAQELLEEADRRSVQVLTAWEDTYPVHLRTIPDRPLVVYLRGQLPTSPRTVACIGTREPTHFGEKATRGIVSALVERGWSIVSGLALGVDALAHEAALEAKGHTVAILGNGLDAVYPKKNADLAERILAAGGAWMSEQPFGAPAVPRNLVQRDRLQSGMSVGTVVMQTDIVGGSMHTVRFTLLQGRLLFAPVPQGPHAAEPKSRGILALTQRTGVELARLLETQGEYAELLRREYATRPVATPIVGREDYDKLLQTLEAVVEGRRPAGRRDPQLGLF